MQHAREAQARCGNVVTHSRAVIRATALNGAYSRLPALNVHHAEGA